MRGESVDDFEMTIVLPGQATPRSLVVSGRPIRMQADGRMGAVLVRRDVTDMRATERQLHESQKLEAVGKLTGGVAHDFNNMLTVIISNAESLADELRGNPGLLDLVKGIDMAADRGADLTRQLLAFARRQPLLPRETNINDLVVASAKLLTPTLGEHIEIESMLDDEAWPALIDPTQLSTALVNLGVNARDAMPEGGKLTFETRNVVLDESYTKTNPEAKPGSYVLVAVSDTGSGIPEAIRDKVLEPFFTTKEIGKGTGLGLSMVYGFVRQSNGHIKIYSEVGHGTSVKLYLPRNTGAAEPADSAAPTPVPLGSETILVVEDDEAVRGSVIAQLHSLGYSTLSAADGAEALALVDSGAPFDLVFTDVIMPGGINGRQLSEAIAQRIPGVKVLYTSGYTENAIVHHGRLDPGVALLNKPYRKADLARKVREVLDA
jgi:signal transduction histidine kinase